jgi:carboxyl-terminal processing protease
MKKQHILLTVFALLIVLIPFIYQANHLQADEADYYSKIRTGLKYFQKVYDRVQSHYVEEIDPYEFVKSGIEGMLGTLDPYTVFIEEEGEARLQIITTGKYGGIGMEIGIRNDQVTVISPMDNSPAQKAGVLAGDILEEINNDNVRNMSLENISQKLRGPIGSEVEITLKRPGYSGEIIMNINRAEIVIEDVNYAGYVAPGVAYIRLISFTDKAGTELQQAIVNLEKEGTIESMILDLRGNSGGLLEAAVEVLGVFLPKGTTVVKTKGFRDGEHSFETHTDPILLDTPLALLVDNGSASASEIVAGALQDLDRAIIVGTSTFGKGLVQKVYTIDKNSNTKIKITTAKYYIPSGRCVQKQDYTRNKSVFYKQDEDSVSKSDNNVPYYTVNKRPVFENGGITPDRFITRDEMSFIVAELWRQSLIFNFAVQYHQAHSEWISDLKVTDPIYREFISYIDENNFQYRIESENELLAFIETAKDAKLPVEIIESGQKILARLQEEKASDLVKHQNEIRQVLLMELVEKYYGNHEKIYYSLKTDLQVQETLDLMRNQNEYKKILAMQ